MESSEPNGSVCCTISLRVYELFYAFAIIGFGGLMRSNQGCGCRIVPHGRKEKLCVVESGALLVSLLNFIVYFTFFTLFSLYQTNH